jgi:hypothetical protein
MASVCIPGKNCIFRYIKVGEEYTCKVLKYVPGSKVMELIRTEPVTKESFLKALKYKNR